MKLNPSCSEAVMRIRVDKLKAEEIEKLMLDLEEYLDENSETYVSNSVSFGIKIVKIEHVNKYTSQIALLDPN